ncbi:MAG TPA: hydantoinase/oxoprolinase family protein, partial [Gemmatales bacterium]|nr:hydantoinase/oxoprolinase family protein [Gemmatales bacterium]
KVATTAGNSCMLPFPLWKQAEQLRGGLLEALVRVGWTNQENPVAITMTGELCDCFPSKAAGVRHILLAVQDVFREQSVFLWRNDGKWASIQHALQEPLPLASANWLASATYAARFLKHSLGFFLDLGSTTLDLIPLVAGKPGTSSRTDLDRLQAGELVYLGCSRTPVCHLMQEYLWQDRPVSLAAEWFATVDDARLVLGETAEDQADRATADGQPRTRRHATARLARMFCADVEEIGPHILEEFARAVLQELERRLETAVERMLARFAIPRGELEVIAAGSGETYLHKLSQLRGHTTSIADHTGDGISATLAAYAVATLLAERQGR